nr:hypothetical protein [Tanacetum cinerariifolium]
NNDGMFTSQDKYVAKILKKFRFTEVKNASTPMKTQKPLLKDKDGEEMDVHMYRSIIGSLMYLTSSRPDIMFAFWSSAMTKTINRESQIHTRVDGKKIIITESSVRRDFLLANEEGVDYLSNSTIFENIELMRGNTIRSDDDSMKLNELIELSTNLQSRVLALEKTKTTQALKISSLKRMVKKLEKKQTSRTHKLKRLYKVGLTARMDSSEDEQNLVSDQDDADMFDVNGEEVFLDKDDVIKDVNTGGELNAASIETADSAAATITTEEVTLAKALAELKDLKPEVKGVVIQEPHESTTTTTKTISSKKSQDKSKGKKLKDLKNKSFDTIQKTFDRAFKRANTFVDFRTKLVEGSSKRAGEELTQERSKKQKEDDDKEIAELKKLMEIIPNEKRKFHREDLEDLYNLVKAKYGSTRSVEDLDVLLWSDLKTMFEPHVEDQVWKKQHGYKVLEWKIYDSYGLSFQVWTNELHDALNCRKCGCTVFRGKDLNDDIDSYTSVRPQWLLKSLVLDVDKRITRCFERGGGREGA